MIKQISIEASSADRPSIKLVFEQSDDRWTHYWRSSTQTCQHAFLTSLEGTPDQDWPASPPLQNVSRHALEQGDALLCVGMAGKSHWSASYSIETANQSGRPKWVKSDLACLRKDNLIEGVSGSTFVGSTYQIDSYCRILSFSADRIEILPSTQKVIVLKAFSGDDFKTIFELNEQVLRVRPDLISHSPVVATRWGFGVQLAP